MLRAFGVWSLPAQTLGIGVLQRLVSTLGSAPSPLFQLLELEIYLLLPSPLTTLNIDDALHRRQVCPIEFDPMVSTEPTWVPQGSLKACMCATC